MSLPHTKEELRGLCVEFPPRTFTPDLRGLIAWLETKEPERQYDYTYPDKCLIAQWPAGRRNLSSNELKQRYGLDIYFVASDHPFTFGAALSRARQLLACTP